MISFTDHYNAIIIDRLASATKIEKDLWHFNNSLLNTTDFCSPSYWWEYTKSQIKDNARTFSKNSAKQENIRIS